MDASLFCSRNKGKSAEARQSHLFSKTKPKYINKKPCLAFVRLRDDGEVCAVVSAPHKITNLEWVPHCSALEIRVKM